jgi:hypothetical protein
MPNRKRVRLTTYGKVVNSVTNKHTRWDQEKERNYQVTVTSYKVQFRCGETISCHPPYVKGELDSSWHRQDPPEDPTDQKAWERYVGMKLLPI